MKRHPKFITLEGIEGVGKSTNAAFIADYLKAQGEQVVLTREPGGTPVAEAIRHVLLEKHQEKIEPYTELLLMFAGRTQHCAQVIRPALEAGKWVVCDRFSDASVAYQGGGRGIDKQHILDLIYWVHGNLLPGLTILLDASIESVFARVTQRGELDRFEMEQKEFFKRIRNAYLECAKADHYQVIDASKSLEDVQANIEQILARIM